MLYHGRTPRKNSYAELFPYSIYPSGRASLDTRGIPVKLGDGPNDLLCGACGQKAIVGLGNVDMVSDVERMIPVVVRCGGCGAYNEAPLLRRIAKVTHLGPKAVSWP